MTTNNDVDTRQVVISTDGHAGAGLLGYKTPTRCSRPSPDRSHRPTPRPCRCSPSGIALFLPPIGLVSDSFGLQASMIVVVPISIAAGVILAPASGFVRDDIKKMQLGSLAPIADGAPRGEMNVGRNGIGARHLLCGALAFTRREVNGGPPDEAPLPGWYVIPRPSRGRWRSSLSTDVREAHDSGRSCPPMSVPIRSN